MNKFKFLKKGRITKLPKDAGVYAFKKGREILYIGKAVNIKERIKQHKELLGLATKVGYIETDSEIKALILEANLIKKYQPKYNIVWRDDKNYFYVGITKEDFP
ncbi:MAG: GIY-YIG nuclease family protein, partial [bacterium]|nr:GIY-YIG nuclease family protein [bacterium]